MMDMEEGLSDHFPVCKHSGFGITYSCRYHNQKDVPSHEISVSVAHIDSRDMQMYAICSGFNGGKTTAQFVVDRLAYEIYLDNAITFALSPSEVIEQLDIKFKNVAARYFDSQEPSLNKRCIAQTEDTDVSKKEIKRIDGDISQGTSTILAIRIRSDLYILNCGGSMALALNDRKEALLLSKSSHRNDDPFEMDRLESIRVNPKTVRNPTRAIGDFLRSYLYKDQEVFENALDAPVISVPEIRHYVIEDHWRSLLLFSDGVVQSLKEVDIEDIESEVSQNFKQEHTPVSTARALTDGFARKHFDAYRTRIEENRMMNITNQREEMAVLYVELPKSDYSIDSTLDSTAQSTIDSLTPKQPYVDVDPSANSPNIEAMKRFLLKS